MISQDFLNFFGKILISRKKFYSFIGLIRAIRQNKLKLKENKTQIFVRRGGPNHLEGLRLMRELGGQIDLPIHVYGKYLF